MAEQRLIDSNADVSQYVETWTCNCSDYGVQNVMAIDDISTFPEIDPKTLPIVRQLREKLERVTAERDAVVKDIELAITIYRDVEGWDILCRFCNGKSCRNNEECKPEWRGPQKEE